MGNNVTRNGKTNNTPTFQKSLLAASLAIALSGLAINANAETLTVSTANQTVNSNTTDQTGTTGNPGGAADTVAFNETGTVNILHNATGGAGTTGNPGNAGGAGASTTIAADKTATFNITGSGKSIIGGVGGSGNADGNAGGTGAVGVLLDPTAGSSGTTTTLTIGNLVTAITGGAGGAGNGAGNGGAGAAAIDLQASAKTATTINVSAATTGGDGGNSPGAATGGAGGDGISISDDTSDAATTVSMTLSANVTGGAGGLASLHTGTAGAGGHGVSSALALGTLTLNIDAGKVVAAGFEGGAANAPNAGMGVSITGNAAHTIVNAGTIKTDATTAAQGNHAINNTGTGDLTITNTGTISTDSTDATTSSAILQANKGVLTVSNNGGTITTAGPAGTIATGTTTDAGQLVVTNQSGGTISSTNGTPLAIHIPALSIDAASTITNAGTITGGITYADANADLTIDNQATGTITGTITATGGQKLIVTNAGKLATTANEDLTGSATTNDSLTMSGTSSIGNGATSAITLIDTITVSGGATATFDATIDATPTAVNVGAASTTTSAIFNQAVSSNVTGTAGTETLRFDINPGANITVDGNGGTDTLAVGNLTLDIAGGQNLDPQEFEKLEVGSGSTTTVLGSKVEQVDTNTTRAMNITDFTVLSGGVLNTGGVANTVDSQNVTIKGNLVTNDLKLTTRAQTVVIDATAAATDTQGRAIDAVLPTTGVNTLTVRGGANTATTDALDNFDTWTIESGTHQISGNVSLSGTKALTLNSGATLQSDAAVTVNAVTSNLSGTLTSNSLTYSAGTNATINVLPSFSAAAGILIDGGETTDTDVLNITGSNATGDSTRPSLGGFTNIETASVAANSFATLVGAVSNVTTFTNNGELRLGGAGGNTVSTLDNKGILDIANTAGTVTVTALTNTGKLQFNTAGLAVAPSLTITNAFSNATDVTMFADVTTNAAITANEVATLTATASYTQTAGTIYIHAVPNAVSAADATLNLSGGTINISAANLQAVTATQGTNFTGANQKSFTDGETVFVINATGATSVTEVTDSNGIKQIANIVSTPFIKLKRLVNETGNTYTYVSDGASQTITQLSPVRHQGLATLLGDTTASTATNLTTAQTLSNTVHAMTTQAAIDKFEDQIDADLSASAGYAAISSASAFSGAGSSVISNRLASLHGNTALASASMGTGISTGGGSLKPKHGVWGQVFGNKLTQDAEDNIYGYDANTYGLAFGVDTQLGRNFTLGFALAYAKSDVDTTGNRDQTTNVKNYQGSVYMGVDVDRFFINGNATYGFTQNDYSNVVTGFGTTNGDYNGNLFAFNAEAGYDIPLSHALTLTPMGAASYTYLNNEEYTETGYAAKTIDSDALHMVKVGVGARLAYAVRQGDNTFTPSLQLMAYHTAANKPTSTFVFADTGATPTASGVVAEGTDQDKNSIAATLGLSYEMANHMTISAQAGYEWESNSHSYGGNLKIRYDF